MEKVSAQGKCQLFYRFVVPVMHFHEIAKIHLPHTVIEYHIQKTKRYGDRGRIG